MGVIAALLVATGHLRQTGDQLLPVPLWVVLIAESAIALGTVSGGWRIVRTMGTHITKPRPVSGFAAETGAAAEHEVRFRAGSGTLTGTAVVPLTGSEPDPDRTQAVAKDIRD